MLQEAVDSLLDNGRRGKAMTGREQASLEIARRYDQGKSGRFRQKPAG